MLQLSLKLQRKVDSIVSQGQCEGVFEIRRLNHYVWLVLISFPLGLLFTLKNLFTGNIAIGLCVLLFMMCMQISLRALPLIKHTEYIYHINNLVFISMLITVTMLGSKANGQILWSHTYPILSVFLFGYKIGIRWSLILICILLINFEYLNYGTSEFSNEYKIRFTIVYLSILSITSWLEFDRNRQIQKTIDQKTALEQERESLQKEISRRESLEVKLQQLANYDSLTQIYNRRFFWARGAEEISRAQRYRSKMTLALIDIDNFKAVNDNYGHPAGDEVLKFFAAFCQQTLRQSDVIGRVGGEEFAIMLLETSAAQAVGILNKLCNGFSQHQFDFNGQTINVTVSVGVCELSSHNQTIDQLYSQADEHLYLAKEQGKNCIKTSQT